MSLKRFLVACLSFVKNLITDYFTLNYINKGFFYSILISNFLIFAFFQNFWLEFLSPFIAIYGLLRLLNSNREIFFWTGFFIGILWFYWVSFSLIYFGFAYAIPLEILFFGFAYGIFFRICGHFKNLILRSVLLIGLAFFHPFSFNWLNLELILMPGIFEPDLRGISAVFAGICAFYYFKKFKILWIFVCLIFALQISQKNANFLPFEISLVTTEISQDEIWNKNNAILNVRENLRLIDEMIFKNKKVIVFPESAFAFYLNNENYLSEILKKKSEQITIIAGAEAYENGKIYNSAYVFNGGEMKRYDKFILVPFGEEIPFPDFAVNFINELFFDGGPDFAKAKKISTYRLFDQNITSAICYEATRPEIYQNNPKFVIAISNNAWFIPSTEPFLQKTLIKYYATKSGATVYHAANFSNSEIITPKKMWIKEFLKKVKF